MTVFFDYDKILKMWIYELRKTLKKGRDKLQLVRDHIWEDLNYNLFSNHEGGKQWDCWKNYLEATVRKY